jgi:undecaprenyl-diphosphatase
VVAAALIVYGVLFIVIERINKNKTPSVNDIWDISLKNAFLIGVFQMLAIIPGTSRSGSTVLGSMLLGLSRPVAAQFSFFLAVPAMAGASLIKAMGFFSYVAEREMTVPTIAWVVLAVGALVAFLVSMLAIKFLTGFVKKHSFSAFGVYRIALGLLVIILFASRVI